MKKRFHCGLSRGALSKVVKGLHPPLAECRAVSRGRQHLQTTAHGPTAAFSTRPVVACSGHGHPTGSRDACVLRHHPKRMTGTAC